MPRRSNNSDPEKLRIDLISLLDEFEVQLKSGCLRERVISLVPAHNLLRDLGCSLIPRKYATAARERILHYLCEYPRTIIKGEELMVVSGISEWARRVRELRVEFGWKIVSGTTAKEMAKEGEFPVPGIEPSKLRPDDYILLDEKQDRDAAFRWNMANQIRRKKIGIRDRILEFMLMNVGQQISGEELRYLAGNKTEWARRVRELRTEFGWQIMTKTTGIPDLPVGIYVLASDRQAPEHDRTIPDSVRSEVLLRDEYKCQSCGWHHEKWNPSDPRHLEAHHIEHHAKGGQNSTENLISLCNICHDNVHRNSK